MEAKKYITHKVTRNELKKGVYSEEYSSVETSLYTKIIILVALLLLSYKICVSKDAGCINLVNKAVSFAIVDRGINFTDSNKMDSTEHFGPVAGNKNNTVDSDALIADTLNFIAQQNKMVTDSMVNSYFDGIDDADSTYRVSKSVKSGTFLLTIIVSPMVTVLPVAVASAIYPSTKHLHVDANKLRNAAYMKGYKYEAHFIKKRKLWGCYFEGGTPWCVLASFLAI